MRSLLGRSLFTVLLSGILLVTSCGDEDEPVMEDWSEVSFTFTQGYIKPPVEFKPFGELLGYEHHIFLTGNGLSIVEGAPGFQDQVVGTGGDLAVMILYSTTTEIEGTYHKENESDRIGSAYLVTAKNFTSHYDALTEDPFDKRFYLTQGDVIVTKTTDGYSISFDYDHYSVSQVYQEPYLPTEGHMTGNFSAPLQALRAWYINVGDY